MFRTIPDYPDFSISLEGKIINNITGKEVIPYPKYGNMYACVRTNTGSRTARTVTNLVKLTFPEHFKPTNKAEVIREAGSFEGVSDNPETWTKEQAELRGMFHYEPFSGEFYRKSDFYCGWVEVQGYLCFKVNGVDKKIHRLIFIYMLGVLPENCHIDHIDQNKQNNAWWNLRLVNKQANLQNLPKYRNNSSGVSGVSWHTKQQKWVARIMVNGKAIQLGSFADKELAIQARQAALIEYGFSTLHGKV